MNTSKLSAEHQSFYNRMYSGTVYAPSEDVEQHSFYPTLKNFIEQFHLNNKKCLEIGSGRGSFQYLVDDYTGVDISENLHNYYQKPFYRCSATELPFEDNTFDVIWSYAVLEHIPNPEAALEEMRRVLKHNGLLLLAPAWQCRSWAAKGYPVRPYSDFNIWGKLVKASIPFRNSVLFRSGIIFPVRIVRLIQFIIGHKPMNFNYQELSPNFEQYWMSDSDAINSMDPFEAILWFTSRGDLCVSYMGVISQIFVRTGAIVFKIRKTIDTE